MTRDLGPSFGRGRRAAATLAALPAVVAAIAAGPAHAAAARPAIAPGDGLHRLQTGAVVALPQRTFTVTGSVAGAPAGTTVRLSVAGGAELLGDATVSLAADGTFSARLRALRPGTVTVTGRALPGRSGAPLRVVVIQDSAAPGDAGPHVRFLTERLRTVGYAVRVADGYDANTARAVLAFRKVNEMQRAGNAVPLMFDRLAAGRGGYRVRFPGHGKHVEGDLTHQVLALVAPGGRLVGVYHTSTGRPGFRTPTGSFRFWRQELGENSRGMVDSSFFSYTQKETRRRAYRPACAIHGYFVVPTIPRSHCCFRVDNAVAREIRLWIGIGDRMDIFGRQNGRP